MNRPDRDLTATLALIALVAVTFATLALINAGRVS